MRRSYGARRLHESLTFYTATDSNGIFNEIPKEVSGIPVSWLYLTNNGIYGKHVDGSTTLFVWDPDNGGVNLGVLPGNIISAINDNGQVLIQYVVVKNGDQSIRVPAIWQNGNVTYLKGLTGDLGIESDKSYAFDMNNKGEVVGESETSLVYKNNVYYQTHAVKWDENGNPEDLHYTILPKREKTSAKSINDAGDVLIDRIVLKQNNLGDYVGADYLCDKNNNRIFQLSTVNNEIRMDHSSIWMKINRLISVNDKREIIAEGQTIYGEKHALLLVPAPVE